MSSEADGKGVQTLSRLREKARRLKREKRIPHVEALEAVAQEAGFPNWHKATKSLPQGKAGAQERQERVAEPGKPTGMPAGWLTIESELDRRIWTAAIADAAGQAKSGGSLIDSGNVSVFSRKYGQSYSHFDVNLAAGGEQSAALSTALDTNVDAATITPAIAAGYFSTAIGGTATPGTQKITLAYGDTTQDLGGGQGSLLHKATITLDGTLTLAQVYQALMWACSESSTITFNTTPGWRYRVLPGQAYAENIAAPFGTFAGGKWFVAQGWWLTGVQAGDSKNYQLTSHIGTVETPPNSVTVSVGGVVAGDYVLVARDTGTDINTTEYTVSGTIGATTLSVPTLKADTPVSGVVRIDGDRYTYTSWTGTTLSGISPALTKTYTARPAFIPMIDAVAAGTTISSAAMQFGTGFTCRYRVRNGGGSPIVPFESTLSVTATGGSGTAVRNADA